ncbi:hypothetical protein ACH5RR_019582 [Cinchona calisaya]|uniref:Pectinesterase inhibitor domain-containing protein n=1 Tax=Cinchona calisaya TaxID=153742 RepID=A0ABD2ZV10_9GENT
MARGALLSLALFLSATYVAVAIAPAASPEGNLEALCKKTHDPNSCIRLLNPTISPSTQFNSLEWYRKVLSKSLSKAITAKNFMTKQVKGLDAKQQIALLDCVDKIDDSVELLQQVSHEYLEMFKLKANEGFNYGWHKKNVQTLMDAATNEQEACYKSLEGRQDPMMLQVRDFVNNAYTANKVVAEIVLDI